MQFRFNVNRHCDKIFKILFFDVPSVFVFVIFLISLIYFYQKTVLTFFEIFRNDDAKTSLFTITILNHMRMIKYRHFKKNKAEIVNIF